MSVPVQKKSFKKEAKLLHKLYQTSIKKCLQEKDPIMFAVTHDPKSCGVNPLWKENGGITNVSKFKSRFTEEQIAKNGKYSYFYARLTGRHFEIGEPMIAKDVESSYLYARYILRQPFPPAEKQIAQYADWSYYYARDVIRGPFGMGELAIAKESRWAFLYALNVLLLSYAEALVWGKECCEQHGIIFNEDEDSA